MSSEQQRRAWRERKRRERIRKGVAVPNLGELIDAGGLPERPSREQLLRALGVRAREGCIPAIRLLLEEYRRDGAKPQPPGSTIDELAKRKRER